MMRWELGRYSTGAVVRLYVEVLRYIDNEYSPVASQNATERPFVRHAATDYQGETFLNLASAHARKIMVSLSQQNSILIHYFNTSAEYVCSKIFHNMYDRSVVAGMLKLGLEHLASLPEEDLDFERATESMKHDRPMDKT